MKRPQLASLALALSIVVNVALVAGIAAMAVSSPTADRVAGGLHLASERDANEASAQEEQLVGNLRTSNWFGPGQPVTVSDALEDLDSRVKDLDDATSGAGGAVDELAGRVDELERTVGSSVDFRSLSTRIDDTETRLEDACRAARSAASQSIGGNLFYVFLDLERALC
jgi:hypothetical protein